MIFMILHSLLNVKKRQVVDSISFKKLISLFKSIIIQNLKYFKTIKNLNLSLREFLVYKINTKVVYIKNENNKERNVFFNKVFKAIFKLKKIKDNLSLSISKFTTNTNIDNQIS